MKYVKILINHVLIPLLTMFFIIIVGISAAGISAIIEYCVLREFFSSDYLSLLSAPAIALILVVVFEFTKLYLHFLRSHLVKAVDLQETLGSPLSIQTASLLQKTKWILRILITISILCTIIFTVTTFHLANYDVSAINAEVETIQSDLEEQIITIEGDFQEEYEQKMEPYLQAKIKAEESLASFDSTGYGPRTAKTIYESLQTSVSLATEDYTEAETRLSKERDEKIEKEKAKLSQEANTETSELTDTTEPSIAAKYDNPVLSQILTVIAQTLFHATQYSRSAYLWIIVLFSIVLSITLEFIISLCFGFISYPIDTLTDSTTGITEALQRWCNELILTILKAVCALFVCIIVSFWFNPMSKVQFGSAILACISSILLVQKFVTPRHINNNKEPHAALIYTIRDSLLEGVVSFMGYILLGFAFGDDALTLDMSTIAIGIGSTLSGCIGYLPQYLIRTINDKLDKA